MDECCCDVETVDSLNENLIHPLITTLVNRTYFKFFRVSTELTYTGSSPNPKSGEKMYQVYGGGFMMELGIFVEL